MKGFMNFQLTQVKDAYHARSDKAKKSCTSLRMTDMMYVKKDQAQKALWFSNLNSLFAALKG